MMFLVSIIALIVSAAAAAAAASNDVTPNGDIAANSALGMRILRQAQVVKPTRQLDQVEEEEEQEERDVTFIANYSIRYLGCSTLLQVAAGETNNNKNNEAESMLYPSHLARFALCPTSGNCGMCQDGGEYVMNMETFVDAFIEARLTEEAYACESVRESCDCEGTDDEETCEAVCYETAGLTNCVADENSVDSQVQRYLECKQMAGNNNNGVSYYTGPYCSPKDGISIHLGVFTDAYCNSLGDSSVFSTINGFELPYTDTSMVDLECHDCLAPAEENNDNGEEQAAEATESCHDLYNNAARCEVNMGISSKDESGCNYINYILPKLTAAGDATPSASCGFLWRLLFGQRDC